MLGNHFLKNQKMEVQKKWLSLRGNLGIRGNFLEQLEIPGNHFPGIIH